MKESRKKKRNRGKGKWGYIRGRLGAGIICVATS